MAAFALPLLSAGISGLAGLFGSKPQTTTTTGTQNTNNTVNLTGQQQALQDNLVNQYTNSLANPANMDGYKAQGLENINNTANANQTAIKNMLAQRGLGFSPAAASSLTANRLNQGAQQSSLLNNIPLMQYQMHQQDLQNASQFSNGMRVGSSTNTTSKQTQTGSGNMTGGLFAGVGSGIAGTLGKRFAAGGGSSPAGGTPSDANGFG